MPVAPKQQNRAGSSIRADVYCIVCKARNPDNGRGQTCRHCGMSPLPSVDYPDKHSALYPNGRKTVVY